jgi:hypothetical protein
MLALHQMLALVGPEHRLAVVQSHEDVLSELGRNVGHGHANRGREGTMGNKGYAVVAHYLIHLSGKENFRWH